MSRSIRMFEIIQHLRVATAPLTARVLAERLEVSVRTVYRDIASLQALRVPVEGAAGLGYAMRPGYDLPALSFADDELDALFIGLGLLGRTGDRALERAAAGALAKLVGTLPPPRRDEENLERWTVSRWHDIPTGGTELAPPLPRRPTSRRFGNSLSPAEPAPLRRPSRRERW